MQFGVLVSTGFGGFLAFLNTCLYGLEVLELQFGIDDLFVAHRIDRTVHMHHVLVVEAAEHMNDGIRLTDVSKELVTESFTLAGTFDEAGYIDDLHGGRDDTAFGFAQFTEFDESLIGNGDDSYVRFDGAEREVRALCFGVT